MSINLAEVYQQIRQIDDIAQGLARENQALKVEIEKLKARIKELGDGRSVSTERLPE